MSMKRYATWLTGMVSVKGEPLANSMAFYKHLKKSIYSPAGYMLVACFPKSGSTFLSKALAEIMGWQYDTFVYKFGRLEQDFFEPKLIDHYNRGTVIHQHLRAVDGNVILIKDFDIKCIVLTRNIFDTVVSYRDHIYREGLKWPMGYYGKDFLSLDKITQFDHIISTLVPWLLGFYASWHEQEVSGNLAPIWVDYESLIGNTESIIQSIFHFHSLPITPASIQQGLFRLKEKSAKIRFNKGISGRGRETLTKQQINAVRDYTRFYPSINFSRIGL